MRMRPSYLSPLLLIIALLLMPARNASAANYEWGETTVEKDPMTDEEKIILYARYTDDKFLADWEIVCVKVPPPSPEDFFEKMAGNPVKPKAPILQNAMSFFLLSKKGADGTFSEEAGAPVKTQMELSGAEYARTTYRLDDNEARTAKERINYINQVIFNLNAEAVARSSRLRVKVELTNGEFFMDIPLGDAMKKIATSCVP